MTNTFHSSNKPLLLSFQFLLQVHSLEFFVHLDCYLVTNNPAGDGQLPNKSETGQMAFSKTLWLISSTYLYEIF